MKVRDLAIFWSKTITSTGFQIVNGEHFAQCDQIGLLLKVAREQFSYKRSPNIFANRLGSFENFQF